MYKINWELIVAVIVASIPMIMYFGKAKHEMYHLRKSVDRLESALGKFSEVDKNIAVLTEKVISLESDFKGSILAVLQQRVITLEKEMTRARTRIHTLANVMQIELGKRENADS